MCRCMICGSELSGDGSCPFCESVKLGTPQIEEQPKKKGTGINLDALHSLKEPRCADAKEYVDCGRVTCEMCGIIHGLCQVFDIHLPEIPESKEYGPAVMDYLHGYFEERVD